MLPSREHIRLPIDGSFRVSRSVSPRGFPFTWHRHDEVELTLIEQGIGRRFVGDSIEAFATGDVVLLGPNVPHTWQSDPPKHDISIVVQFQTKLLADRPELKRCRRLVENARRGLAFRCTPKERSAFVELTEASSLDRLVGLYQLLDRLSHKRGRPLASDGYLTETTSNVVDASRLDRAIRFVETRRKRDGVPPEQRTVARHIGLTPSAFCRFFQRATGRSFTDWTREIRIGRACKLLDETDLPITHVATESGYANLSHFNRQFREVRGTTPRAYRQSRPG
ncbi:MAG: helix-turn-helix domain-containing protein [Planctomycetota bacterium]